MIVILLYFVAMNILFLPIYWQEAQNKMVVFILCMTASSIAFLWVWIFQIPPEIINEAFKQGNGYLLITYPFYP